MSKKRNKKYFIATLAGTIVASSVVMPNITDAAGNAFSDVKADDYFSDAVLALVERGLVKGFPDGTFKPYSNLTRGQAAVILAGVLELDTKNVKNPNFKDVSTSDPYYGAIAALANAGYIKGFENGTYGAAKPITRNHMAIILTKAFNLKASMGAVTPFTDIYPDYKQYITALYENGISVGTTKTTFGGATNVTRGQFAQFLVRAESAKSDSVSFTIENLSISSVQTTEGKLSFDTSLKSLFATNNASALKGAEMTATVRNGKITGITALTLNAEGKDGSPIVLDGGNATIAGDVTVNGDYIAVNNLKVNGDIILTSKVAKEFSSNSLVTDGELIINEAASNPVASLFTLFANTNDGPKINIKNSSIKSIQVERNKVQLTSDKKLPEVRVAAKVSSIEVNADVEKLTINVSVKLEIKGSGAIDQIEVEKAVEFALNVAGQVKELIIGNKETKVEVGVNLLIDKLVVPKGSKVEDVVSNYYSVKDKIKDIKDEAGSTVTPPSTGGSTGGNNSAQVKQALINTANQKIAAIPVATKITADNQSAVKSAIDAAELAISAAKKAGAVDADFAGLTNIKNAKAQIQKIAQSVVKSSNQLKWSQIARYDSGEGETGTEILAYDTNRKLAFVTNGAVAGFDILSFESLADLQSGNMQDIKSERFLLKDYGIDSVNDITSIASHPTEDIIAISAVSDPKTDPGYIIFTKKDGTFIKAVQVGSLPDMVTFTPDGKKVLVANEGEPSDDYTVNPDGTISVIDLETYEANTLEFTESMLDENVRVSSEGSVLSQLEPEYITVSKDSKTAYVTLQENNAIATIDLVKNKIVSVKGLGVKDYSEVGNELDALNNKEIKIEKQPILSYYMPDAIDTYTVNGKTYIITPNEGDTRDYEGYSEVVEVGDILESLNLKAENYKGYTQEELDAFVEEVKKGDDGKLADFSKVKVSKENGKNAEGQYEALYSFGGRSFSIFEADSMELVYDSGSDFERIIAELDPANFNTTNDEIKMDNRSDDKGPEPESAVVGEINGVPYAFIALERYSGVMVYDLSDVSNPKFVTLISSRDFSEDVAGDVSPEGLVFIPAEESPTGNALLTATHEISGTVAVYEFESQFKLSLMHSNDTHGRADVAPKRATAVKQVRAENPNSLLIDAGDVFSGTLYFNEFEGQADLKLMNYMGYDVMTFGNHEFDLGSSPEGHQALADFIEGAKFSFVSSNVDFSPNDKFAGLFNDVISSEPENGKIYSGIVKEINGEKVGIFGLTTEETTSISSPGSIVFENYIEEAEKAVKAFEDMGVDKIIAVTHIGYDDNEAVDNDQILAKSVDGIDVIVGGHSHTKIEEPVIVEEDSEGKEKEPTVIVQAYQYSDFLGNLDVTFDENGVITEHDGELLEVSKFEEDPEAVEILKPYKDKVQELNETEIGVNLTAPLTNPRTSDAGNTEKLSVRKNETILGNLITDGMLSKAKEYDENVVMAFTNGGGIRSSIGAGPITIGEVISVLPFGNTLALMDVTGAELKAAFETSLSQYPLENGGFLHVAGAKIEYDSSKPGRVAKDGVVTEEGQRIISISYKNADGSYTEIKDDETYTVATNAFTAKGGDGYDMLGEAYKQGRVTDLGLSDWENFRDHLQSLQTIPTEIEGRIVEVEATEPEPVVPEDLIISEYIEGSGTNKAIELYNGTGQAIDLSNYTLELYANSGDTGTADGGKTSASSSLKLEGTLENGKTYVLYNSADTTIVEKGNLKNTSVINFNGNDPIVLKKGEEVIDSIGQAGSAEQFGKDVSYVRKDTVITGDRNLDDEFSFETEWISIGKDFYDNLGEHPYIPEKLETISMAEARVLGTGEVQIQGVVTGRLKNTIHIQDETGAIALFGLAENVKVGDEIVVKGRLSEYNGLLQLQSPVLVESVGFKEVTPTELTGVDLKEENESKLATVKEVTITNNNGSGNYAVKDEAGTSFIVRDENSVLGLEVGKTYDSITGIIQEFKGAFQIIPRGVEDVIEDASKVRTIRASSTSPYIPTGTAVELSTLTDEATIYYTTDGTEPTVENGTEYTAPIVINEKTTLKAIAVKEGLSNSDVFSITYDVYDGEVSISDIQGEGHTSPMNGTTVEGVEGIVTSVYELNGQQYFHMQTPDSEVDGEANTSEGIVVYAGSASGSYAFKVGSLVSVTGVVDEYRIDGYADADTDLTVTQLNARNGSIKVLEENVELPTPIIITSNNIPTEIDTNGFDVVTPSTDAIDYWESLEGMRVQIGSDATSKLRVVSPEEYGEIITVFDEVQATTLNGGLLLGENDVNAERIQFKLFNGEKEVTNGGNINTGDYVNAPVVGFVNYGYSNFKIYVDQSSFATTKGATTKETTSIEVAEGKLTIASYNLENFSATSNATKVSNIADAFVNGLNSPDIIGITEMQDNDGATASGDSSADKSYEKLIDAIKAAGGPTYEYVNIDPEYDQDGGAPGGNIRVGFLYNPAKVSLPEGSVTGTANDGTEYVDGKLTLNPGRINPTSSAFNSSRKPLAAEFNFNGEQVIVIVNHWNSKGGDSPLFGTEQPPVLGSEVQRKEIAQIVRGFVETIQTANSNANIVAVGDFNDFQWTPALQIFEGENESMVNMINTLPENDRYSYTYQGNSQALDHIFVSNNLKGKSNLDILHVNADFTEEAGRASDHDPLMIQIDFTK